MHAVSKVRVHHHWHNHRSSITELTARLFPSMFTVFLFATFAPPIFLVSHVIGAEYQVRYWISENFGNILYLWILYLFTHIYHLHHGAPSKPLMVFVFIFSCLVLIFTGLYIAGAAADLADDLEPTVSCASSERGFNTEMEWQFAREFYTTCMAATANESKFELTFDDAVRRYRIPHCAKYSELAGLQGGGGTYPTWQYLADTETEFRCAGWCVTAKEALWTYGVMKDGCAAAVAAKMGHEVHKAGFQIIVYTLFLLAVSPFLWRATIPVVREFGAEDKASDFHGALKAAVSLDF